jgi:tryptophan-rich sensory protein
MGIAAYKVWILKYENIDVSSAIFVYAIQLLLNFLWTIIFFGFKLYGLAFLELVILILFVILTIKRFYDKVGKSSILLIPYLIWLIYAGVLNFFIWMLNEM